MRVAANLYCMVFLTSPRAKLLEEPSFLSLLSKVELVKIEMVEQFSLIQL